jgi:hypothetical protein
MSLPPGEVQPDGPDQSVLPVSDQGRVENPAVGEAAPRRRRRFFRMPPRPEELEECIKFTYLDYRKITGHCTVRPLSPSLPALSAELMTVSTFTRDQSAASWRKEAVCRVE